LDAGAGGGDLQHCASATGCLEFRGHSQLCQEGNSLNCAGFLNGTYAEGPCPPEYEFTEEEQTGCGPTGVFLPVSP
jgi:hypothetical protein